VAVVGSIEVSVCVPVSVVSGVVIAVAMICVCSGVSGVLGLRFSKGGLLGSYIVCGPDMRRSVRGRGRRGDGGVREGEVGECESLELDPSLLESLGVLKVGMVGAYHLCKWAIV
jgi:hypothetical protein